MIGKGTVVHVQVRLSGVEVVDEKYDLCEGLKVFGQSCPFELGAVAIATAFKIPQNIPHVSLLT